MRRTLVNIIMVFAAFALQTSVFPFVPYVTAVPNFLLIIVFTIAFAYGELEGVLFGILCGFLVDCTSSSSFGFYTLIYAWIGYMNGVFSKYYYDEYLLLPLTMCAINEFVLNVYIWLVRYLLLNKAGFELYFKRTIMPEIILTIVFTLILYRPVLAVDRTLKKRDDMMKVTNNAK